MRVYLRTFGCRANQYDTETVRAMVLRGGGEVVDDPTLADIAVFNSCAVTTEAEADLRKDVRATARRQPALRSVIMGCAASLDRGVLRELPTVQSVIPGADYPAIADALGLDPSLVGSTATVQSGARALLRIQDGCNEHCTFCATTIARGAHRSRDADTLVAEARQLAEHHPEIVLTGVHIGSWGIESGSSLGALVARLIRAVPGARFRLSSLEATEVDDQLRELFGEPSRLVPHLHAPLQSGSDRVLKRMGRHWYTARSYAAAVERLLVGRTAFALGADVIAGFPGESDDDHAATIGLVRELPFSYLHVFPYSARPGTAATRLGPAHNGNIVTVRARELRELAASCALAYRRQRIGAECDVVVIRGETREALTEDYLSVTLTDAVPRATRLRARLQGDARHLLAAPLA